MMMKPLRRIHGRAIPLDRADVDTDQIIPARHLKRIERTGFGRFAFEEWRKDGAFVLNDPRYAGAPILIAGPNFGCGSSREHAPWALQDLGIEAIIAPSFADIFRSNCIQVGLLTVRLSTNECEQLMIRAAEHPESELIMDLEDQTLKYEKGAFHARFEIDPFVKHCLMNGLDAIDLTLQDVDRIDAFESERPRFFPKTTTQGENRS